MAEIEVGFECTKAKPGYWDVREALENAILSIKMPVVVDKAAKKMERRGAKKEQVEVLKKKLKKWTDDDFVPVKKIVELDTAECKGNDKKVTGKIELADGLLEDLDLQESEIIVGAVGRALEDAQFLKPFKEGDPDKDANFYGGRVMNRLTKWNIKTD